MNKQWRVTYEIVTEESAIEGDASECGFLNFKGERVPAIIGAATPGVDMSFREALDLFNAERDWTMVEADCDIRYPLVPGNAPHCFTDYGEIQFASGETRSVSLHIPDSVTTASRYRLARLLECYGA